mgnify:FL=1
MNIFTKLDDAVMGGVNAGVRAYNWTTGGTKKDLANNLLTMAPISTVGGYLPLIADYPAAGLAILPFTGLLFALTHVRQLQNNISSQREESAREKNSLDMSVEKNKTSRKILGYMLAGLSTYQMQGILTVPEPYCFANVGLMGDCLLRAGSEFTMCADYIPPRKNCVKRGWEELEKRIAEYRPETGGLPQPV